MEKKYMDLNENIRAPQELKDRVLRKAAQMERKETGKPGIYSRGFGLMPKIAAAAAVLLLVIPLTAFAAHQLILKDHLKERGLQDETVVQELVNTFPTETTTVTEPEGTVEEVVTKPNYENEYAEYTLLEVVFDENMMYLCTQIKPKTDEYLLMPSEYSDGDDVSLYGLGEPGTTMEDYVKEKNKPVMLAGVAYYVGEAHVDGAIESNIQPDGTILQYYSGMNIADNKQFTLRCSTFTGTVDETIAIREAFDVQVTDKSTSEAVKTGTKFDDRITAEAGLTMVSLDVEQTELGTYFTFTYKGGDEMGYNFFPVDAEGNNLPHLPNQISTGGIDNGDGTWSETVYCQKLESLDGLQFKIRRFSDAQYFGPYAFPD